jgi:iron complex transport system permease protein
MIFAPMVGKQLNAFAMGEADASYVGVNVGHLKKVVIVMSTMAVGASVAVAGMIGFVGLVVPHTVRLVVGPDHRVLLPASMLLGAVVLVVSDLICRTIVAPQELPVGIATAVIGAPVFIMILLREKRRQTLAV